MLVVLAIAHGHQLNFGMSWRFLSQVLARFLGDADTPVSRHEHIDAYLNTTCTNFSWALLLSRRTGFSSGECTTAACDSAATTGRELKAAALRAITAAAAVPVRTRDENIRCHHSVHLAGKPLN